MKKSTVLVIFGGRSSEYEVSLISAHSVITHIPTDKYAVLLLGITKDGKWYYYDGDIDAIPSDEWQGEHCRSAALCPDYGSNTLIVFGDGNDERIHIDAVFPVLHGKNGEDGTIQGLFELAGIPFVGCGHLSSAMCMDKAIANTMLVAAGINHADWCSATRREYAADPDAFLAKCEKELGYPMFAKPANAGSSIGISKVHSRDEFDAAIKKALAEDYKVVVEEAISGKEIECAVLGADELFVSIPGEIRSCNEFYDYDAKYVSDSELLVPAELPEETAEQVREVSGRAFRALGCSGITRVDSFVTESGEVIVNELNTIPGFTSISMYSKLLEANGIPYAEVVDRLIEFGRQK